MGQPTNPKGDEKYWLNGESSEGVYLGYANTGEEKYFLDGITEENIAPMLLNGASFLVF
jgi:hypothetical protein